jgi:hypothetical protein
LNCCRDGWLRFEIEKRRACIIEKNLKIGILKKFFSVSTFYCYLLFIIIVIPCQGQNEIVDGIKKSDL